MRSAKVMPCISGFIISINTTRKRAPGFRCLDKTGHRRALAVNQGGFHPPAAENLAKHSPAIEPVVHHQHAQALQAWPVRVLRNDAAFTKRELNGEMKCASGAGFAP